MFASVSRGMRRRLSFSASKAVGPGKRDGGGSNHLARSMGLLDATALGIGSIIGAGIFVVLGVAYSVAGPAVLVSVVLAGIAAALTGYSYSFLARRIPREGGAYEFAHEILGSGAGFLTGFVWIVSNVVALAAVSLGFGHYFSAFSGLPVVPVALAACALAIGANLLPVGKSAGMNNALVAVKLAILALFVLAGLFFVKPAHFSRPAFAPAGWGGIVAGAGLVFFAFGGFARITTASEEVRDPKRTIPLAIFLGIGISALLYLLIAPVSIGLLSYGPDQPKDFLAQAAASTGLPLLPQLMALGALIATFNVLLTTLLGLSRIIFAMARNYDLPRPLADVSDSGVPWKSVLFGGIAALALTLVGDLGLVVGISSFAMLCYYGSTNLAAAKLSRGFGRVLNLLGLVSCLILALSLPGESIAIGALSLLAGGAYYLLVVFPAARRGIANIRA